MEADLAKASARIAHHMNDDHSDSLLAYARYYGKLDAKAAAMTGVTAQGFELDVTVADGSVKKTLVPYSRPLKSAGDVRKVAVEMHFAAYNGLGVVYKLKTNFYGNAVKQAWTHMPAHYRRPAMAVAIGLVACLGKAIKYIVNN